jgi:hypothetical protein
MTGKITLISPPDVFVNKCASIMLVNIDPGEQESVSNWFTAHPLGKELNIYFYNNEQNPSWLVTAYNIAHYRYINIDNTQDQSGALTSYLLSLDNSYYSTASDNTFEIFRLLNTSRVNSVEEFLNKVITEQYEEPQL